MAKRLLGWAPLLLVACGAPQPAAPTQTSAPRAADEPCEDTCCPRVVQLSAKLGPPSADEMQRARSALAAAQTPLDVTMALHRMSGGLTVADMPAVARCVDDTRPGASVPHAVITQEVRRCYPVTWTAITPSSAALAALETFYATSFPTPSTYRAWTQRIGDPERSFEVWNARLARREPPAPEMVEAIRASRR